MKPALSRVIVFALAAGMAAAAPLAAAQQTSTQQTPAQQLPGSTPAGVTSPSATDTRMNKRDRNDMSPTSGSQSNARGDIKVTAGVRKAIVHDDSLSMDAHNIKIITRKGVVVLRGPVKSAQEKTRIGQLAAGVQGVARVDNQLDIATNKH